MRINNFKKNKGFTLIELMVVISIITFLSSIVLAAFQQTREKARFAAAMTFYKHTQSILFDKAIYVFNFNDFSYKSTGLFSDSAINPSGLASLVPDLTLFKSGYNLSIPSNASIVVDGIVISNNNVRNVTNGYDFTIATWFKPVVSVPNTIIFAATDNTNAQVNKIRTDASNNVCIHHTNTESFCSTAKVEVGKWHYIAAVYKKLGPSDLEVSLFVDGKLFKKTFTGVSLPTTYNTFVTGTDCCSNSIGLYDEVVISDITF